MTFPLILQPYAIVILIVIMCIVTLCAIAWAEDFTKARRERKMRERILRAHQRMAAYRSVLLDSRHNSSNS